MGHNLVLVAKAAVEESKDLVADAAVGVLLKHLGRISDEEAKGKRRREIWRAHLRGDELLHSKAVLLLDVIEEAEGVVLRHAHASIGGLLHFVDPSLHHVLSFAQQVLRPQHKPQQQ